MSFPQLQEQIMLMSFARFWNRRGEHKAQPIRKRATPTKKKPPTRPTLEALEDRLVPTIAFTPQFGAETYTGSSHGMQNPDVYLIFEGTWSQANENTVITSLQNILTGPYLSKLTQYGSDGHATYAGSWNASSSLSGNPDKATLQDFLQKEIAAHPRNEPINPDPRAPIYDEQHAPIYVVLSDPASSAGTNGGYNKDGRYKTTINGNDYTVDMHMVWMGTGKYAGETNTAWKDIITNLLSHELVETIADPTTSGDITPPSKLPPGIGASGIPQIGDFEAEGSGGTKYGYRLNGDWLSAYWSKDDKAFVVPDGNTQQTFYLQPIWNSSNQFNGQYNLSVVGDQRGGNHDDAITIDQIASGPQAGGVTVNLNGYTASFDPTSTITIPTINTINAINVNTEGGTNRVNVFAVPAGVTLNVNSWSLGQQASNDTVIIGPSGSLANIAGKVNVANQSGKTQLIVSNSNDTNGHNVQITNNVVKFSNTWGQVNYTGATPNANGTLVGVTSLVVDGSSGGDVFTVSSTAANTPLTLSTGPSLSRFGSAVFINGSSSAVSVRSYGNDSVYVGKAGSLAGIGGPVNVSNVSGQDSLTIDDSNDKNARSINITSNAVKIAAAGSEPAVTINYTPAQKNNNGQMVGVKQLTIWDAQAANQITVDSVGPNTDTTIEGDTRDSLTGAAAGKVRLKRNRT